MSDLTPETRTENFWVNEGDLEPITRKEQYIKHLYDETQVVPDHPVTREEYFINKAGEELHDVTIEQLSVTQNGEYSESGVAYSPVLVNVPQPTLTTLTATENRTYTAPSGTAYNEVDVNVPLPENAYLLKSVNTPTPIASFNDGEEMVMPTLKVAIEPQQEGSGDPSPTNVRPIRGWDEVDVTVADDITNKSFFDGLMNGTYGVVDLGSLSWSYVSSGDSMRVTIADAKSGTTNFVSILPYTASFVGTSLRVYETGYTDTDAFKTAMNGVYLIYELATPTTPTVTPSEINELYEEFGINGATYTIDLDGTRYGGEVDVVNGIMTVDRVLKTFSNADLWTVSGSNVYLAIPGGGNGEIISDIFLNGNTSGKASYVSSNNRFYVWDAVNVYEITTREECQAFFNGHQLVYELATPITVQLTPTAVNSLLGSNNVWADTGDIKDAEYFSKEV